MDRVSGEEKASVIAKMGREALALSTDVSQWPDVEKMVSQTLSRYKRIDILVNNAGILGPYSPVMEYPGISGTG